MRYCRGVPKMFSVVLRPNVHRACCLKPSCSIVLERYNVTAVCRGGEDDWDTRFPADTRRCRRECPATRAVLLEVTGNLHACYTIADGERGWIAGEGDDKDAPLRGIKVERARSNRDRDHTPDEAILESRVPSYV